MLNASIPVKHFVPYVLLFNCKNGRFQCPSSVEGLKTFKECAALQYTNAGSFQQALLVSHHLFNDILELIRSTVRPKQFCRRVENC